MAIFGNAIVIALIFDIRTITSVEHLKFGLFLKGTKVVARIFRTLFFDQFDGAF